MARVALASVDEGLRKKIDYNFSNIAGVEVLSIKVRSKKHKKKVNKLLYKNNIKYLIAYELNFENNIDGRELINSIYPEIIKRYAKIFAGQDSVSVYAERLDDMAKNVIFMLCEKFKYISVFSSDYNKDKFFDEVLEKAGVMPLEFSENDSEAVFVLSGGIPDRRNIVDLKTGTGIKIYTPDKKVISPPLCEAVLRAKMDEETDILAEFLKNGFKVI